MWSWHLCELYLLELLHQRQFVRFHIEFLALSEAIFIHIVV
jgi:hypothetical protein